MIRIERVIPGVLSNIDVTEFIRAYQEAFGGPPYYETYSDQEVLETVWEPHLRDGVIILAKDNHHVVGFGCSIPLLKAPDDVQGYLRERHADGSLPEEFDPANTWYMSELGVLEAYRRQGLAYELVRHRLTSVNHGGATHYVMRTAAEGSNSRHLYEQVGSRPLAFEQDMSDNAQVTANGSHSTSRVYLFGSSRDALRAIVARQLAAG